MITPGGQNPDPLTDLPEAAKIFYTRFVARGGSGTWSAEAARVAKRAFAQLFESPPSPPPGDIYQQKLGFLAAESAAKLKAAQETLDVLVTLGLQAQEIAGRMDSETVKKFVDVAAASDGQCAKCRRQAHVAIDAAVQKKKA